MPFTSPSNRCLPFLAIAVVGAVAISMRGYYLLRSAYAAICATVMVALVWLLTRSLETDKGALRLRTVFTVLFASAVSFSLAFPALVNGDLKYLIDKQAIDRLAHRELVTLLESDPAFRDLVYRGAVPRAYCAGPLMVIERGAF